MTVFLVLTFGMYLSITGQWCIPKPVINSNEFAIRLYFIDLLGDPWWLILIHSFSLLSTSGIVSLTASCFLVSLPVL